VSSGKLSNQDIKTHALRIIDYQHMNNPAARPTTRQVTSSEVDDAEAHIVYAFIMDE
jgi:hypothetical protein